jgi:hypothetical protein
MANLWIYLAYGVLGIIVLGAIVLLGGVFVFGREKTDKDSKKAKTQKSKEETSPEDGFSFGADSNDFVLTKTNLDENSLRNSALRPSAPSSAPKNATKQPGSFFGNDEDPFLLP